MFSQPVVVALGSVAVAVLGAGAAGAVAADRSQLAEEPAVVSEVAEDARARTGPGGERGEAVSEAARDTALGGQRIVEGAAGRSAVADAVEDARARTEPGAERGEAVSEAARDAAAQRREGAAQRSGEAVSEAARDAALGGQRTVEGDRGQGRRGGPDGERGRN